MSPIAFLRQMLDAGMDLDHAMKAAEAFETSANQEHERLVASLLDRLGIDAKADERRRRDRQRKAAKKGGIPQNSAESAENAEFRRPKDAPAHVGDNKPTSENNKLTSPRFSAGAFEKPTKADLDALDAQLAAALGSAMASKATSPKLFDLSPILGLLRGGQGPPADLDADVLPVLKAAAARSSPGSIRTWAYFVPAIREARDRRLSGAPIVQLVTANERPNNHSAKTARDDRIGRMLGGAMAAVDGT